MSPTPAPHYRYSLLLREIDNLMAEADVSSVALVLLRLRGLGDVNRELGYLGGDRVLEDFGARLAAVARAQDRSFEINGSTFVLLIRNPLHEGHAALAADRLAAEAETPFLLGTLRAQVRAHMGISLAPQFAASAEDLLYQAELALEAAAARDQTYRLFDPVLAGPGAGGGLAPLDVEEALKRSELEVFYQPKLALRSGELAGAEALLRWRQPDGSLLSPGGFLPGVERGRGIRVLFWHVLNAALRTAAEWRRCVPDFRMAVNVSPANLEDPDFADLVAEALGVWDAPPDRVLLEITETAIMSGHADIDATLAGLRELGVALAIDDFGTGYSSLAHLRRIPVSELKIDKSFVQPVLTSPRDREIVAAVIRLGHALGLEVVAEGIETPEAMQALLGMGCDLGQGYHFGRPVAAAEFARRWLAGYRRGGLAAG